MRPLGKRTPPEGLEVRLAREEDYDGVVAISDNIYDGMDYLPALYKSYIRNPLRILVVGVLKGEIVAFAMGFIVDDGQTVVYQAGRVKREYQKLNIMFFIFERMQEELCKRFPRVYRACYTTINKPQVDKDLESIPGAKLVTVRSRVSVDTSVADIQQLVKTAKFQKARQDFDVDAVQLLSSADAERILQQEKVLEMSPEKYWITAFEPLGALACNAKILVQNIGARVFLSVDPQTGRPVALSFGGAQAVKFGVRYRMDFYVHPDFATRDSVVKFLASHVLRQMEYVPDAVELLASSSSICSASSSPVFSATSSSVGVSFSALYGQYLEDGSAESVALGIAAGALSTGVGAAAGATSMISASTGVGAGAKTMMSAASVGAGAGAKSMISASTGVGAGAKSMISASTGVGACAIGAVSVNVGVGDRVKHLLCQELGLKPTEIENADSSGYLIEMPDGPKYTAKL